MTRYRLESGQRTGSAAEAIVMRKLMDRGYVVLKRGWPDFVALKGNEVRFIEVKRDGQNSLKPRQKVIAEVLERVSHIKVEMLRPSDVAEVHLDYKNRVILDELHELAKP